MPNVRDQRRRAVGAPLAESNPKEPLAVLASGVTTSAERCIALLDGMTAPFDHGTPQKGRKANQGNCYVAEK
jgi:hypothetical protein